ncbi:hypothetical protein [Xanthomonas translucens]|uniref:hypothetical protein n=1 Tax=Xanthomonas campestris pv. translucens TaxID=343 RepID=UPI0011121953|nr:hypothetical protein [Xanthomonas translucens]
MARTRQLIVFFLLVAGFVPASAFAGWGVASCPVSANCNQGRASASCDSQVADFKAQNPTWTYFEAGCRKSSKQYDPVIDGKAPGGGRLTRIGGTEYFGTLCTALPPLTSTFAPKSGSISCSEGCEQAWFSNPDGTSTGQYIGTTCNTTDFPKKCGTGYYWNSVLSVCEPTKEECPAGQVVNSVGKCAPEPCPEGMTQQQDSTCKPKQDECPAGQVKGPDGSCVKKPDVCGTGQAQGKDGTCKPDKDGDGNPDDEDSDDDGDDDKKSFSGGDSCAAPPSCSGDPVMCGQARIQWRIDCNTRRNVNIAGGACGSPPVCTGDKCDAMEYSQLLMQWRTACATEKLLTKGNTNPESGQPEWTKVGGMSQDPGAGANSSDTNVLTVKHVSTDDLDRSGFGGGACIGFANAGSGAVSRAIGSTFAAPPPMWCDYMARLKAGLIIVASCVAVFILTRGGS